MDEWSFIPVKDRIYLYVTTSRSALDLLSTGYQRLFWE
jgi:hypothetical protein